MMGNVNQKSNVHKWGISFLWKKCTVCNAFNERFVGPVHSNASNSRINKYRRDLEEEKKTSWKDRWFFSLFYSIHNHITLRFFVIKCLYFLVSSKFLWRKTCTHTIQRILSYQENPSKTITAILTAHKNYQPSYIVHVACHSQFQAVFYLWLLLLF